MAAIAKNGSPSITSLLPQQSDTIVGYTVGEDIAACDACYIDPTSNNIYRCDGAQTDLRCRVMGFAAKAAKAGQNEPLTLYKNAVFGYGTGLTPGWVYLSPSVKGGLDTAPSTNCPSPCGFITDSQQIHLFHTSY